MAKKKKGKAAPKQSKPKKAAATKGTTRVMSAREYEKLWKDNKSKGGDFENDLLEPGIYTARITGCSKGVSKKGAHYFSIRYLITEGEYEGSSFSAYTDLGHEVATSILGQSLSKLRYNLDEIAFSQLSDVAKDIKKDKVDVEIEIQRPEAYPDRQNVYIRSVVE